MKPRHRFLFAALAVTALAASPTTTLATEAPLVVELFTSQGCSSCPPADSVIADLADRPGVIVLSLAVDYWDYLGWKDTLARPANTQRQRAYADARGDLQLYTPQVIVNGQDIVAGHDRAAIEHALIAAKGQVQPQIQGQVQGQIHSQAQVRVSTRARDGKIEVAVAGAGEGRALSGEVWALGVQRKVRVDIGRGENAGRTATYRNVVRGIAKLASWSGQPMTVSLDPARWSSEDCDLVVVLVQDMPHGRLGAVVGAVATPLR
jgi:hypothetical protein